VRRPGPGPEKAGRERSGRATGGTGEIRAFARKDAGAPRLPGNAGFESKKSGGGFEGQGKFKGKKEIFRRK
jgi:hypothetical protein